MTKKLHPVIQDFFESRKAAKLKADIKESTPPEKIEAIQQKYDEIFDPITWIAKAAPRASQISLASHPSKFSHPDAAKNDNGDTTSIIAAPNFKKDGYLRSGNTQTSLDAIGNAAALDVYQFLHLTIDDKTIIEHLQTDTSIAKDSFSNIPDNTYQELKSLFLKMINTSTEVVTSSRIKQVYFPINSNAYKTEDYHLLSLISNSGLIYKMKKYLDTMHFSDETKALRELRKAGKHSSESYSEVFDSVTIAYGGSKSQNISVLNKKNHGEAYLLASFPPELKKRDVRFPTKDFFSQCINQRKLKGFMQSLDRYYKDNRNNMAVRETYSNIIHNLIDEFIITKMWQLREVAEEQYYEASSQLPTYQKIWLTEDIDTRLESDDWLDELMKEITTWISTSYRSIIGENKFILMGEAEHDQLVKMVQEQKINFR